MIASSAIPFNPALSNGNPLLSRILSGIGVPVDSRGPVLNPAGPMAVGTGGSAIPQISDMTAPNLAPMVSSEVAPMQADAPQLPGHHGFLARVGDYLHQPGVAAALFRSGAATINGGLGAGLEAAGNYMDQRRAEGTRAAQQQFENAIAEGRLDLDKLSQAQRAALAQAGINVDILRLGETNRSNRANESIAARGQDVQKYGIDTNADVAREGHQVQLQTNAADNAQSNTNSQRGYDASIYGTNGQIVTAGIGSRGSNPQGYTETKTTTPSTSGGWFSDPTPKTVTTTRMPVAPQGVTPGQLPAAGSAPPPAAIDALRANPGLKGQFDAKYGNGASARYGVR